MSEKMMYARFEDVQVGDTIRIYREIGVDHVQETTAVVERKTTHQLFSVNNRVLYVEGASKSWGTIDILSRPEPPKPVLPTKKGARIVVEAVSLRPGDPLHPHLPMTFTQINEDGSWEKEWEGKRPDGTRHWIDSNEIAAWHLAPEFPRTIEASEAHEHVGCRVTVEGDGYALTGRLTRAKNFAYDLTVDMTIIIDGVGAVVMNVPTTHPITLEAPASAGASVVGGA